MQLVDFHTHFFARPFFDALAAQSPQAGTPEERLARVIEATGIELPSTDLDAHVARWIGSLDAGGVSHMVTFASAPEEIPAVGAAAARSNGRISAMAVCNPLAPHAAENVAKLLESGAYRGVLLFPAMHLYSPADPRCAPLFEVLARHRAVAYVHCGLLVVKLRDLLGLPRRYDLRYANPLDVIPAASAHPEVTFCVPHFGAGFFRETRSRARSARTS
ncbi:MAG: amidohydrolase family protein [Planctomycetota bacterium]